MALQNSESNVLFTNYLLTPPGFAGSRVCFTESLHLLKNETLARIPVAFAPYTGRAAWQIS